jgi:integrase
MIPSSQVAARYHGDQARWSGAAVNGGRGHLVGHAARFRFHDLRHYLASLLIASGADIKMPTRSQRLGWSASYQAYTSKYSANYLLGVRIPWL